MNVSLRPPSVAELMAQAPFETLEHIAVKGFESLVPKERLSVSEAAERYMRIGTGGGHSVPWSAAKTPYIVEPMDTLTSLDYQGEIFVGPARTGKALALDTPIPTPRGWTSMGDVRVGEHIFGADGNPTKITFATEIMHNRKCYRVRFSDGCEIVADADHQWFVRDLFAENEKVMTTQQMVDKGVVRGKKSRKRFAIWINKSLNTGEVDLPIDPYVFGAWLGDGSRLHATLSCGRDDYEAMRENIEERGYRVRCYVPSQIHRCYTLAIAGPDGVWLDQYLSTAGITDKYIPQEYLRASEYQRRELLRGLCDTDGTLDKRSGRRVAFTTVEPHLAEQVAELVRSLGHRVNIRVKAATYKGKRYRDAYEVQFLVYDSELCFSLKRKIGLTDIVTETKETQTNSLFIDSIEPVASVPVRCIQVDAPDHLFLAGRSMVPTHNTMIHLAWTTHTVLTDPADTMLVHMDMANARKWSKGDLNRFLEASKDVRAEQISNRKDDNVFDKTFVSGMKLLLTYPTASNLSGITVPRVGFIDYERMDDNVEGEGNAFDLGQMRTTTFKRFGMAFAEASPNPNKEIMDPKWTPSTPHEAPPIRGIFELYNRGDRRLWYWRCLHCREAFEPHFKLLRWADSEDIMECRETTYLSCPKCGGIMEPQDKEELNSVGRWVKDGMMLMPDGRILVRNGMKEARSTIASFWLKGPAAAYQEWGQLVEKHLRAMKALADTNDDAPLRKTVTTDQGNFYIPASRLSERSPEDLKSNAEDWGSSASNPTVPYDVRFLIGTVDVQGQSFVAQVQGFTSTGDMVIIDGFKLRLSDRRDGNGDRLPINPAAFAEDWDILIKEVMLKTYELDDGSGRRMGLRATGCDSGGREGVTGHAYNFWRRLRKDSGGLHRRFILLKGEPSKTWPHARTTWPDSSQKGIKAIAKGDVPVLLLNSNLMKDRLSNMVSRRVEDGGEVGGGMIRYPSWMPAWFYLQMTTEIKDEKGWDNPGSRRNESWDLAYYALGIAIRPMEQGSPHVCFGIDRIDYDAPPTWAAEWDANDFVSKIEHSETTTKNNPGVISMEELGKMLA